MASSWILWSICRAAQGRNFSESLLKFIPRSWFRPPFGGLVGRNTDVPIVLTTTRSGYSGGTLFFGLLSKKQQTGTCFPRTTAPSCLHFKIFQIWVSWKPGTWNSNSDGATMGQAASMGCRMRQSKSLKDLDHCNFWFYLTLKHGGKRLLHCQKLWQNHSPLKPIFFLYSDANRKKVACKSRHPFIN
jgi:hypothetical protein